ncbi:MAG TPA: hypothetical protein VNK43_08760, partial [Gemmatimonadales bacterium]|nr:hypothetical protein [Gemmatimonadales bacterium]
GPATPEATHRARVTPTSTGRVVLVGRRRAGRVHGLDRWVGGVRLVGREAARRRDPGRADVWTLTSPPEYG